MFAPINIQNDMRGLVLLCIRDYCKYMYTSS
jgi:hypothetical protein